MNSLSNQISLVIPVFNGEESISKLIDHLVEQLSKKYSLEVILINDCSPDNSENICIDIHKKYPQVVSFFSLSKNVGEHNAVMAGLNNAKGNYVVIMDDDFQNPVSEVNKLINYAVDHNYDAVYTYYEKKHHSYFRNLGSRFNDKIANIMLKKPKDLYLSSFKILNRFLVNEIIKYQLPYPYIDGLILRTTSNIGKIQVEHQKRENGNSGYTFKKLLSLWLNMFTNFSILPLRISIIIGFIFSLFGFGVGIQAIIEKLINPEVPLGYTSLIIIISIFSGIQLIAIGMVGEYIGRVFLSQNKKPQYSIRRSFEKTNDK
jgi:glycosyltransferase involved in cell wall biosynthesis